MYVFGGFCHLIDRIVMIFSPLSRKVSTSESRQLLHYDNFMTMSLLGQSTPFNQNKNEL